MRFAATAFGLGLLALGALLYGTDRALYATVLGAFGFEPFRFPFLDTHYLLAGSECWHRGIDVYAADPCDVLGRPHIYSPLWLRIPGLAATPWSTAGFGLALAISFLAALSGLPPPQGRRELLLTLLATGSSASVFAVERGNADLLVFVLAVAAVRLATRSLGARTAAYGLLVLAALLKFYPAAALVLAARERPKACAAVAAAALVAAGILVLAYRPELAAALPNIPHGDYFSNLFGAVNLPYGIVRMLTLDLPAASGTLALRLVPTALLILLLLDAGRRAVAGDRRADLARLPPPELACLVVGAALICGCFLAGQSVAYRAVLFLLVLPGLLALRRSASTAPDRARYSAMAWAVVLLMWEGGLRGALLAATDAPQPLAAMAGAVLWLVWLARELCWWWLVGALLGLLVSFLRASETWTGLRRRVSWSARSPGRPSDARRAGSR